jgi:hypothetical protein
MEPVVKMFPPLKNPIPNTMPAVIIRTSPKIIIILLFLLITIFMNAPPNSIPIPFNQYFSIIIACIHIVCNIMLIIFRNS